MSEAYRQMPLQLGCHPRPRRLAQRCRRVALGILLLVLFLAAAHARGAWLWRRSQLLFWQDRCLSFRAPPSRVVYETNGLGSLQTGDTIAARVPRCWESLRARLDPAALQESGGPAGILFLHERRSPAGVRRLVVVRASKPFPAVWDALLIDPASVSREVNVHAAWSAYWPPQLLMWTQQPVRLFAGQPDDQDASHFTVAYEIDGRRGTIDGWLRDCPPRVILAADSDGDGISDAGLIHLCDDVVWVDFAVRDGPLMHIGAS